MTSESLTGAIVPSVARRISILSGHTDWQKESFSLGTAVLKSSQFPHDTSAKSTEKPKWQEEHDPALEVAVTPNTLKKLMQYHGSLVKISCGLAPDSTWHIARLMATHDGDCKDHTAYLSPSLAFNLGLQLHLVNIMEAESLPVPEPSGNQADTLDIRSSPSGGGTSSRVQISRLEVPTDKEGYLALKQPGLKPAFVRVAEEVALRRILRPDIRILNLGRSAASDTAGSSLTAYIIQKPRLVVPGDVLAVASELQDSDQYVRSLYSMDMGVMPPTCIFFKVEGVKPHAATALVMDPKRTKVLLRGSCNSFVPPGISEFLDHKVDSSRKDLPGSKSVMGQSVENPLATHSCVWADLAKIIAPLAHKMGRTAKVRAVVLLQGPPGSGQQEAVAQAAKAIGVHLVPICCEELRGPSDYKTAAALKSTYELAADVGPAILLLKNLPALLDSQSPTGSDANSAVRVAAALRECLDVVPEGDKVAFIVATAPAAADVMSSLRRVFTHELTADAPDLGQRSSMLRELLPPPLNDDTRVVESVALRTAGLLSADIRGIVADAAAKAIARTVDLQAFCSAEKMETLERNIQEKPPEDHSLELIENDLDSALEGVKSRSAEAIGAPQIPDVRWEDVGGLENIKETILETIELPLRHPELFANGLRRRSGLLLYGPPGTGKTLVAKAVATECSINFLSVKGPELINMYIGESERQVREVFSRAQRARPCVLFFDELDSLAPARGGGADSGGVMDRVVSQLLAEVDGLQSAAGSLESATKSSSQDIFLIGATNRLDKLLYVGIAERTEDKLKVLQALTRKFQLATSVDLQRIAESCGPTLTGADLYALCADAWMAALRRITSSCKELRRTGNSSSSSRPSLPHCPTPQQSSVILAKAVDDDIQDTAAEADDVEVEQCDFQSALASLTPSLSQDELARYAALRNKYEGLGR